MRNFDLISICALLNAAVVVALVFFFARGPELDRLVITIGGIVICVSNILIVLAAGPEVRVS